MRTAVISFPSHHRPVVGVLANSRGHNHGLSQRWLDALHAQGFDVHVIAPGTRVQELRALLPKLDGILLPGGDANIHPSLHSRNEGIHAGQRFDRRRDITAIALALLAVRHRIPILGICRGMQEMNVALGGSLHQSVKRAGFGEQRMRPAPGKPIEDRFREVHRASIVRRGMLNEAFGATAIAINSIHTQGIKKLGRGLVAEAFHGRLMEAFSLPKHPFFLGVQWHPEVRFDSPSNAPIWHGFRVAVETYAAAKAARRPEADRESQSVKSALVA
ncbi:MAG TPA: gamma-glutamyl-gamma-aminobutyrate hydrolase family protein [Alphaproteobacteria bacterium]|nr:gamma-glutamyl-gamma-aminobutyrate hydrolase family protein [Alphaproteobacteria bacterium]